MTKLRYHFDLCQRAMSWSGGCIRSNAPGTRSVAAARALVADGVTPTVELTAERARTSLTTAYRYFPSQAALLAAAHPEITMASLLPPDPPADVGDRLELVVARVTDLVRDTEPQQRTMLRLSLDPERPGSKELLLRQGASSAGLRRRWRPWPTTSAPGRPCARRRHSQRDRD